MHGYASTRVLTVQVQSPCHHGLPCHRNIRCCLTICITTIGEVLDNRTTYVGNYTSQSLSRILCDAIDKYPDRLSGQCARLPGGQMHQHDRCMHWQDNPWVCSRRRCG